ncbi:retrovirus-related Pol polyprotein from transposon 17.6 [Trichonephila clavipes]|nr:retrovirus-related Pol polyprotein from transposon 17.6 [Trichonephila clavipes]
MNSNPWRSNYTQNPKLSYEHSLSGFPSQSRRETGIPSNSRRNPISKDRIPEKKIVDTKEDRTPISCYGCGAPGIIRSRCHTCNPVRQKMMPCHQDESFQEGNIKKQEIDRLLSEGIIEECESPYASAVVLIPKPNGTFRLCIDYRKLNEITIADTYPLPRMDDLLHQAKLTPFMSTLDLRAGYHQVKVHVEDQDKTAFVCPFGTYRFLRMPYAPPVLKQADGTKPYIIRTDASNYALGAVLLQGEGSDEHPIEYASRLLTPAERNYSTTEREALAVVWALKKFRGYIEGTEITVASDHQPLKWLLNLKSPTGRLARWALEIQSFNLKVQYIPGNANVVADMLSRPVTQEEESFCEENNITIADMPTRSCNDMREVQLKDDNLKKIIDSFESPLKTEEYANWTERGFLMNQGVLYRYVPDADSAEAQLVIPTAERELIMERHHNDPMAGHYGEEGTFRKSPDDITGQA